MKKTVSIYDARGNGNGEVSPTLTGDHQNRVTDHTVIVVECFSFASFGNYVEAEICGTLRAKGDMGDEMLIVEHLIALDNAIKINGGAYALR